jgi:hypothetical protein
MTPYLSDEIFLHTVHHVDHFRGIPYLNLGDIGAAQALEDVRSEQPVAMSEHLSIDNHICREISLIAKSIEALDIAN